jgi:hypothetical protein
MEHVNLTADERTELMAVRRSQSAAARAGLPVGTRLPARAPDVRWKRRASGRIVAFPHPFGARHKYEVSMNKDQVKGVVKKAAGKVQERTG